MSASKTVAGRRAALAQMRDTLRTRKLTELHRELDLVSKHLKVYANTHYRGDVEELGRMVSTIDLLLSKTPLDEGACDALDNIRHALFDVHCHPPLPGRLFVAVAADAHGQKDLAAIIEARFSAPPPPAPPGVIDLDAARARLQAKRRAQRTREP